MLQCYEYAFILLKYGQLYTGLKYYIVMNRSDAFYKTHAIHVNAALIATHANSDKNGFRQRDVRFYIELLSNWSEANFKTSGLEIKNTQIQRLLDSMTKQGYLKSNRRNKSFVTYQFTSIGLLEIISRLIDLEQVTEIQDFYFLFHCVSLYSNKMEDFLIGDRKNLPKSYQLEIKHLLNARTLIERQRERVQHEIKKLNDRIQEAYKMSEYAKELFKTKKTIAEVVLEVESKFPYQLNNQKRMSELFKSLSPDIQLLEISDGPAFRARTLWEPLRDHFTAHLEQLDKIEKHCN